MISSYCLRWLFPGDEIWTYFRNLSLNFLQRLFSKTIVVICRGRNSLVVEMITAKFEDHWIQPSSLHSTANFLTAAAHWWSCLPAIIPTFYEIALTMSYLYSSTVSLNPQSNLMRTRGFMSFPISCRIHGTPEKWIFLRPQGQELGSLGSTTLKVHVFNQNAFLERAPSHWPKTHLSIPSNKQHLTLLSGDTPKKG